MADIKIYGKLVNKTDGIIADSEQIKYNGKTVKEEIDELTGKIKDVIEIDSIGLDNESLYETGIYNIKSATELPKDAKISNGKLVVEKTSSGSYQEWSSDDCFATRLIQYKDVDQSDIRINGINPAEEQIEGVSLVDGVLSLSAEKEYEISGYLKGRISINTVDSTLDASKKTILKLAGLFIDCDSEKAIDYGNNKKSLKIVLKENCVNYIQCKAKTQPSNLIDKMGAIHSENNLEINGIGYLAIRTNYRTHGIFAREIYLTGKPHIYVSCKINVDDNYGHDAIHCGKSLFIENGEYEFCNCNDAIGLGADEAAVDRIFAGKFNIHDWADGQNAIDGGKLISGQNCYIYESDYFSMNQEAKASISGNVEFINQSNWESKFGVGEIYALAADGSETKVDAITATGDYKLKGYFPNELVISATKVELVLENACIPKGVNYTAIGKNINIKSDDIAPYNDSTETEISNINVSMIGNVKSGNHAKFSGKGILIANDVYSSSKTLIYGDGNKYFSNIDANKFYIGADDDAFDTGTAKKSKGTFFINSLKDREIGAKAGCSIFITQKGDFYINKLEIIKLIKRNKDVELALYPDLTAPEGAEYIGTVTIAGNPPAEDNENAKLFTIFSSIEDWKSFKKPTVLVADWFTLSSQDVDANLKTYESLDAANQDLVNLKLGAVVSVKSDDTSEYINDYNLYIVVASGSGKTLKEIKQGGGNSYTGDLTFDASVVGFTPDSESGIYECPVGSTISFRCSFVSADYPDVRGSIFGKINGETKFNESVYPREGQITTWNFSTIGLTPGTYEFSLYGKESTGRTTARKIYTFQIGGLNIKSSFVDGSVVQIGNPVNIPLTIEAADTSSKIHLQVSLDGVLIADNLEVSTKTNSFVITAEHLKTGGVKNLSLKLINEKGKESNELKYTLIAAEMDKVYILTDSDIYDISDGGVAKVQVRTIQLGYKDAKYKTTIEIKDSADATYKETQIFSYNYGLNELDLTGLRFNKVDGTEPINGKDVEYSKYKIILSVESPVDETITDRKEISIRVRKNDYNIEAYKNNLICYYTAEGKSNSAADRDKWNYEKTAEFPLDANEKSLGEFEAVFNNFNWQTNGWIRDDAGNTALKLNHGAYVEIKNCAPFYYDYIDTQTGALTISVDFKTKNILDPSAKVISCLFETTGTENTTYYLRDAFGDYIKSDENGSLTRELCYTDETKTEVRLVNIDETVPADRVFDYDKHVYYGTKDLNGVIVRDDSVLTLTETAYSYGFKYNNIIRFFMNKGGYCWVDGVTYLGTGNTLYDTTMIVTERTINYNFGDDNPNYTGKLETIAEGQTEDLKKKTGTISSEVTKQTGFYIDTENAVLTTSSSPANVDDKFHLNFSENTRTHIDLIINRSKEAPYYFSSLIGYTNGVLSLMKELNLTSDKFNSGLATRSKCYIYLGAKVSYNENGEIIVSDTGDADIYNLRLYNEALSPNVILQNYASEIPDLAEKEKFVINNGIGANTIPQTLPRITLIGANIGSDSNPHYTINDFIMQLAGTNVADLKSIKEPAYFKYYDPSNDKYWTITSPDGTSSTNEIPIRLQFQGTSSMVYPCKNYKMKLYNPYVEKVKGDGVFGFSINNGSVKYGKKWKVDIGNGIPDSTICLKADYMGSSHTGNTSSANFIADYNNQITGTTPASEINSSIRTTIYGYPCLLYYKEKQSDTEEKFLGVYNCNLDKSDTDCFGLDKEVKGDAAHGEATYSFGQSQFIDDEFSNDILMSAEKYNAKHSTSVATTISLYDKGDKVNKDYKTLVDPETGTIVAALSEKGYLRTLNNDTIRAVFCAEVKANSGASGAGGFGNYALHSVASDMEMRYPDEGDIEDENYSLYSGSLDFDNFTRPYWYHFQRLIKWLKEVYNSRTTDFNKARTRFLAEVDKHFNRNYLIDYYLTFMLLGGVDSLGKNLMIGSWGPENHLFEALVGTDGNCYCYDDKSGERKIDNYAFEYNRKMITPTKVYHTNEVTGANEYIFATDETGKPLYYKEESYDRYTKEYKNGRSKFSADDVTNIPGEWIWYPTYYDIDTIAGLDNAGQLIYDVDIELDEVMDDGTTVYNTSDSVLWQSVQQFFGVRDANGNSMLSDRWTAFTNMGLYNMLVGKYFYERAIATIPAKYYNDDCFVKYIWEGPNEKAGSGAYLYCVHGDSYEQLKRWFSQRIIYLDSYFAKIGTENASIRSSYAYYDPNFRDDIEDYYLTYNNDGTTSYHYEELARKYPQYYSLKDNELLGSNNIKIEPIIFKFKTYQPGYVGVRWFNGGKVHFVRVGRNKTAYLSGNIKTNSNQEIFIFGGSNIKEIGDLSNYNIQELNIKNLSKLGKLILGNSNYTSVVNKIDGVANEYLSELNIEKCTNINKLELEPCSNLKVLNMKGSGVTSVSLPDGGSLETIYYPSSITNITLRNLTNLATVNTDTLYNLSTLIVDNCPKIQGATGKENYNSKLWDLLQGTEPSPLSSINVEAYGSIKTNSGSFFFPDKYYNYDTAKNIKGEIEYLGTTVPKNYTKFVDSYPKLKITYPNINDASEMFANYKNLNCISSLSAFAGRDIYGNSKYVTIYYWTDETNELRTKWHTTENYEKYGNSKTYSEGIGYYVFNDVYYRLLSVHDDADLDILRAEIKSHVSNFSKFIKLNGMFKNMSVLDYLDPDTFNNVDISEATTDEMFYGCTGLQYFETPTDIVKNEILTVYLDEKGAEIQDTTGMDVSQLQTKQYYINPFNRKVRLEFTDENKTSKYAKGMRKIGKYMFYQCKKAKIYIKKLQLQKSVDDKISIAENAFEYISYDPNRESQLQKITVERPVILFEHAAKDLLATTENSQTIINKDLIYDNPAVENEEGRYYSLNIYGEREINHSNSLINFASNRWLREVYFGITKFALKETIQQQKPAATLELSYAENTNKEKILFKLYENDTLIKFNSLNELNIISESVGAFPLTEKTFKSLREISLVIPKYDCLDTVLNKFDIEKTVYPLFATDDNNSIFDINSATISASSVFNRINVVSSEEIPENYFKKLVNIKQFCYDKSLKKIGNTSFQDCVNLQSIGVVGLIGTANKEYFGTDSDIHKISTLATIGNYAFYNCASLTAFLIPNTVTKLGNYIFQSCARLQNVAMPKESQITVISKGMFSGCIALNSINDINNQLTKITSIEDEAFDGCIALSSFIDRGEATFYKMTALTNIGISAFHNCNRFGEVNLKFKIPTTLIKIGSNAFSIERSTASDKYINFVWDENEALYQNLEIGNRAFANFYPQITATGNSLDTLPSLFIPKVKSIGDGAFNLYGSDRPYKYCLVRNSKEEIGDKWVNYTNKIIYNYKDLVDITDSSGTVSTYILADSTDEKYSAYDGIAYLHHVTGTTVSYTFNEYCNYNNKKYLLTQVLQNAFDTITTIVENFAFAYGSKLEIIESGVIKGLSSIRTGVAENESGNDLFISNIIPDSLTIATGNTIMGTSWYNAIKNSMTTPNGSFITLGKYIIGYKPLDSETNGEIPQCNLDLTVVNRKYNLVEYDIGAAKDIIKATYSYSNGKFVDSTGNELTLVDGNIYKFNNNDCKYSATDGKFYLYNSDIPSTVKIEFPIENYLSNCTTVFDNAFSAAAFNKATNIVSVKFPMDKPEYNIYTSAFEEQKLLTELTLPKNIKQIAQRAFYLCNIENLKLPNTITSIGYNAFKSSEIGFGSLKFVDMEDGLNITSAPFNINTNEIRTNVSDPERLNITLNSIHIPTSMSDIFSFFYDLRLCSQMKDIYLGELELNQTVGDEKYGTIYCNNYPLYFNNENGATFNVSEARLDSTGQPVRYYTDSEKKTPLYVPKFYHDICLKYNAYTNDYSLTTTEKYGVVPRGDYTETNDDGETIKTVKGFAKPLNLKYLRTYNLADVINDNDREQFNNIKKESYSGLSAEQILRILAAYTTSGTEIFEIVLPADAATLSSTQEYLFTSIIPAKYKITRLIDVAE